MARIFNTYSKYLNQDYPIIPIPEGSWMRDLTGFKSEKLTVIGFVGRWSNSYWWKCVCECGNERIAVGKDLKSGKAVSCGCFLKIKSHGMHESKEYNAWENMIQRCTNQNHPQWHDYGGRGIRVCERWLVFENFFSDMGHAPDGTTLDRFPNNNGHYEPGNARWATYPQQARNRRNNHIIEWNGRRQTITDWAIEMNLTFSAIRYRISAGWTVEEALTTPLTTQRKAAQQ